MNFSLFKTMPQAQKNIIINKVFYDIYQINIYLGKTIFLIEYIS